MEAQAEQRVVTASGSAMNLMGPETDPRNPSRLTRRGRQQVRHARLCIQGTPLNRVDN